MKSREIIEGKLVQASQKNMYIKDKLRLTLAAAALSLSDGFSLQFEGASAEWESGAPLSLDILIETWKGRVEETL